MPTYDYKCKECKKIFTIHVSVDEHDKNPKPACQHCGSNKTAQMFSHTGVSVVTSKKS